MAKLSYFVQLFHNSEMAIVVSNYSQIVFERLMFGEIIL